MTPNADSGGRYRVADASYQDLFDHIHKSFEDALVACMDYFRHVWVEKDEEIKRLQAEVERLSPNDSLETRP
jgi:bacterioferritin (cytochrome b1)